MQNVLMLVVDMVNVVLEKCVSVILDGWVETVVKEYVLWDFHM